MTVEIKEILESIKNTEECSLSGKSALFLLDYITNLQQENEKLKYNARGQVNDYFKDKYADEVLKNADLIKDFELTCYKNYELQQENEFLEQENERLKFENGNLKTNEQINVEVHNKQLEIIKEYKSRCEKVINAIDILQEIIYQQPTDNKADDMWLLDKLDGFKNILNGSDEK